ncbi:MAG TPA: ABC transporter substrate-binding protein [Candidatus Saccharimonadales bacterium]
MAEERTKLSFEQTPIEKPGVRHRLRQLEKATVLHARNFIVRRFTNLKEVRRTALLWVFVAGFLVIAGWSQIVAGAAFYSHIGPVPGGVYIEGSVGKIDTLNPIFASNPAERTASHLLFPGLVSIDEKGSLVGDLAESWSNSDDGKTYTFILRPEVQWSDGKPITASDVTFTVRALQNTATRSPYAATWQHIQVEAPNERTVTFRLPAPFAPFVNALTIGILPQHVLSSIPLAQLRGASFNLDPTTSSGPFAFRGLTNERPGMRAINDVYLVKNENYVRGVPKLDRLTLRIYKDNDALVTAMREREIVAASDIPGDQLAQFARDGGLKITELEPFSGVYAFLKQSNAILADANVRRALLLATDRPAITKNVHGASLLEGPLVSGQPGAGAGLVQASFNLQQADALLAQAGWVKDASGKRLKNGEPLRLSIVGLASSGYASTVQAMQKTWSELGIEVESRLVRQEEFQTNIIGPHAYDVLVYELALGRDSDVYPYWHSSQAVAPRLNLSEYRSVISDEALEAGRTRINPALREAKYRTFVEQWLKDVPAIALYRPHSYYVQLAKTEAVKAGPIGELIDRFANVQYWTADIGRLQNTE